MRNRAGAVKAEARIADSQGVMQTALRRAPTLSRLSLLSATRRSVLLVLAVGVALALVLFAVPSTRFGDAPLFLLVIPLGLCAFAYGLRGGLAAALIGSLIATSWWIRHDRPDGWSWYGSRVVTYVLLGILLGKLFDSRMKLLERVARHADLSLDLIATANFDGYFTTVNPAFTRALGYSIEELTRRPFIEFIHPDDRAATQAEVVRQTEAGEEVLHFQNRYLHKNGSYRWLEWTSHPDPASRTLVAVARDVTDRKQLEERERAYQQELERAVRERTAELQRRNEELEAARRETLRRLALAAEYRDDDTFEHTERVGHAAALLAAELGLPEQTVRLIREAAPLHDVGKLGVSDTILLKPGKLSPHEFEQVKRHADIGASILAGSDHDVLQLAEEIASTHHEWWDGTGYPRGLKGEEIPRAARIVAIVDVFDALTHTRPYKRAWPVQEALREIQRLAGRQFDPELIEAFMRLAHADLTELPADCPATAENAA